MPTTTTYGYKKPIDGERGTWWDNLNDNTDRLDGHTHNGTDSAPIPAKNLSKGTNSILAAGWSAVAGVDGLYKQTVTLPSGYAMATLAPTFILTASGHQIYPTIEKVSATTYDIYINDNTLAVTALYA